MADNSAFLIWEKIQPLPGSNDIAGALRSEVHDPLWLLARQWQMGEFAAEDAGMAAFAHIVTRSTPVQRFQGAGQATAQVYNLQEQALNTLAESIPPSFDLSIRLETGRMWQKMLKEAGKASIWEVFRQNPLLHFKVPVLTYESPDAELASYSHEPYLQMVAVLGNGRMVDGGRLYKELQTRKASDFLTQADPLVNELGDKWVQWVNKKFRMGTPQQLSSWDAARLEYRSSIAAVLPDQTPTSLHMPEYNGQLMDGFSWEQSQGPATVPGSMDTTLLQTHWHTFIPSPVSFPGMPRARWWEFEDSTLDLSNLKARKTDLGLLLLAEFGLVSSNDWLLTPLALPIGHLAQIRSLKVTDVFGVQSSIQPARQDQNWELFGLSSQNVSSLKGWLYLPPVANHYLQSTAVEEIHFIRDEMANMAWGVEKTVPDRIGEGMEGHSAALHLEDWLKQFAGNTTEEGNSPVPNLAAPFTYSIGNTVPPHWIPFIPLRLNAANPQMVLRRAAMPRFVGEHSPKRIRPRTDILQSAMDEKKHYDIQEEEIPATGISVRQLWRRARWLDGRTLTWLAREKSIGRAMESSGLQFDILE